MRNGHHNAARNGVSRELLESLFDAIRSCDPEKIAPLLDPDIEWLISGPAEVFDFYGARHGKEAVLELLTRIGPCFFRITGFELEDLLIQDDRAAAFGSVCGVQTETGRVIRYRCARFMQFRNGRLVSFRAVADTLDAAQQLVGRAIRLNATGDAPTAQPGGNVVAI
jgi:ketosteroid isomerase-like protein